ncbi:MAG TPA: amidohydrolase [Anaeromyxobacteraceae bacterium]|nr:amidohydrolase [Anaeromyxobacteraceae bacterium]
MSPILLLCLLARAAPPASGAPQALGALDALYPELEALYLDLHRHPELSRKEERTAARLADRLERAGYEVTRGVGGTGVVGVLRNGNGPTVLLRTELDALPLEERTGLSYASTVPAVMHACGHDVHMASWAGAAELLSRSRTQWRGTIVMVGQPAEEIGQGARAMIDDGLLRRFPRPDYAIALHGDSEMPAGMMSYYAGYAMANVDSVDVTIFGKGGHGAHPEKTIDPIVIAARTILALQTIVARENDPRDPAVVTVGSIHGGSKHNIIPDEVKLQLTVRSFKPEVRAALLTAIARIVKAEAAAANAPREPAVTVSEGQVATYNDPGLTRRLASALAAHFGRENVIEGHPDTVAEDFGEFGRAAGAPSVLLRIGTVEPARFQAARQSGAPLPPLHSSAFVPDRERTIRTGAGVLTVAALEVLAKP